MYTDCRGVTHEIRYRSPFYNDRNWSVHEKAILEGMVQPEYGHRSLDDVQLAESLRY